MDGGRTLTDADIAALVPAVVKAFKAELIQDLQREAGKGVFFWARKAFWLAVLALAVYGMFGDKLPSKPLANKLGLSGDRPVAGQVVARIATVTPAKAPQTVTGYVLDGAAVMDPMDPTGLEPFAALLDHMNKESAR